MRRFQATTDGAAFEVEVDGETVRLRDAAANAASTAADAGATTTAPPNTNTFVVSSQTTDGVTVAADGHPDAPQRALVIADGDETWVWIDGEFWTIDVEQAERARRPRAATGSESLSAPMPATIIRILVEPGREVKRGETLLLLEAMKMELPVRAPRDGRVKALHGQAGELVQPGVPLVELE